MTRVPDGHEQTCTRCGSHLIHAEWDEPVNAGEVQYLWRCWNCNNEFITTVASEEKQTPVAEITEPFFTSLVVE
jgi:DNA-directed RNA polymerase subunit RPC12/RpoP